jgi:hypothetical protein
MTKDDLIQALIGKEFIFINKKCKMVRGSGSAGTIWVIKKGFWGEHVIQAHRLRKDELYQIYFQIFGE